MVVDTIWKGELDEHNVTVAEKTAYEFNNLKLSDQELEKNIALWNQIQPGTDIEKVPANSLKEDQFFTVEKKKKFGSEMEPERYRSLKKIIYIHHVPYLFTVETNIEESQETVSAIAMITIFFFILIVIGLLFLNKKLSASIWKPFRNTLDSLKTFNLNNQTKIELVPTDITEFEELNQSLQTLIGHTVSVYKAQKEFTENASHEMQTPLAILKNKLDNLLQTEELTEKQYAIVEEMNRALTRSSRINKNLLLLAKIDNNQFDNSQTIQLDVLLRQSMETLREHFDQKNITVHENIASDIRVNGNSSLTEVLINNMILNAIRHTPCDGSISVKLTDSVFEVANSGTEQLNTDLLFKRFSKLSSDNSGSGLGLAIISEICKFHHWTIHYKFENQLHIFSVTI